MINLLLSERIGLTLLLIIVIFIASNYINLLYSERENFESIMASTHMVNQQLKHFNAPEIPEYLEISKLEKSKFDFIHRYGLNKNYIWNDGNKINMSVLRQNLRNNIKYDDMTFRLRDVAFEKSKILFNGKLCDLQLNLIHSGTLGKCDLQIIIPILLDKKKNNSVISDLLRKDNIPQYTGGTRNFGSVISMELSSVGDFLENNEWYRYQLTKNNNWLIMAPVYLNIELGMAILDSFESKQDEILNEPSWLDIGLVSY